MKEHKIRNALVSDGAVIHRGPDRPLVSEQRVAASLRLEYHYIALKGNFSFKFLIKLRRTR